MLKLNEKSLRHVELLWRISHFLEDGIYFFFTLTYFTSNITHSGRFWDKLVGHIYQNESNT